MSVFGVLLAAVPAAAQAERYELGRRVRLFEEAWEKQPDPAARTRALKVLGPAAKQFLSFNPTAAARTLDEARFALRSETPPTDAVRWLAALYPMPEKRLIDAGAKELKVEVRAFYEVKGGLPKGAAATLQFDKAKAVNVVLDALPAVVRVPVPDDGERKDRALTFQTTAPEATTEPVKVMVTTIPKLSDEVAVWKTKAPPTAADHIDSATEASYCNLLARVAAGDVPETDLPLAAFAVFPDVFKAVRSIPGGPGFFFHCRVSGPGQFWMSVPTGKDRVTPCRVFVPKGLDAAKPVPLVVALHGAGGSENLFFDGYGAGHIVKECEKRGWLLVAPRCPLGLLGGSPPVPELIEALKKCYPIDPARVFLVGHSMGAGQAVELVQQKPGFYAGLAVLGGAGRVRKPEPFAELPVFVGVGTADFALGGSRALAKALTDAGAKRVTFREYPDVEHLVIVRQALPDVFEMFDAAIKE